MSGRCFSVWLVFVIGCSTEDGSVRETSVYGTTEPTTQASMGEEVPRADCECVEEEFGSAYVSHTRCGWTPCGFIEMKCIVEGSGDNDPQGYCREGGRLTLDVEAVDCSLAALVAGEPALIKYYESPDDGFTYAFGLVKVGEGRMGLVSAWSGEDLSGQASAIEVVPLKDAAYFVGCQQLEDPLARYECLKDWTAGPAIETCAPAHSIQE